MSSLIVLCPHCLTWIELHAQCCTECGVGVSLEDDDPPRDRLSEQIGERLLDAGQVSVLRRGWPSRGQLIATTEGLLFVPLFTVQANGSLEAITLERPNPADRIGSLFHWWSMPVWRQPTEPVAPAKTSDSTFLDRPLVELLIDSPGAFFVRRDSIQRIGVSWGRFQIERRPARSVSLVAASSHAELRESLRRLLDYAPWRTIVASL